jgi:dipicolinate synthase subunit A
MLKNIKIGILGGDLRQLVAAQELAEAGYEAAVYGFDNYEGCLGMVTKCVNLSDAVRQSDFILLPLPYSLDGIHLNTPLSQSEIHFHDIFNQLEPDQIVLAGKINGNAKLINNRTQVKIIDYYEREDLTILNALLTAEGAVNIAMQEMLGTISNSKALILGYGRIGKLLAHKLYGLQAQVYISARRQEDLAWIEAYGYSGVSYDELDTHLDKFDAIYNTVPSLLLDESRLEKIKQDCVIIDLASNPGGVDFNAAKNLGRNVIWALSLPGEVIS